MYQFGQYLVFVAPSLQALYQSWVLDASRNILTILEDMPSLRPPIDHLCELMPRLQPRYYSIASSSKVIPCLNHPEVLSLAAKMYKNVDQI